MHLGLRIVVAFVIGGLLEFGCVRSHRSVISESNNNYLDVKSAPYLGQKPPGMQPEVFAPGIISTGLSERDVAISPDGKEFYFCAHSAGFRVAKIFYSQWRAGGWTKPRTVSFSSRYVDFEPALTTDGNTLFFLSNRPLNADDNKPSNQDIWAVERTEKGWSEAYNLGAPINTPADEFFPSLTADRTLYFTRDEGGGKQAIYRSRFVDNQYQPVERLPKEVNHGKTQFNAFVAPDESYLIIPVAGAKDNLGRVDYYVVFRTQADRFSQPINLGPTINMPEGRQWSAYVSPDSRYLFFMSSRFDAKRAFRSFDELRKLHTQANNGNADIWWVDAEILQQLKPAGF